MNICIQRP